MIHAVLLCASLAGFVVNDDSSLADARKSYEAERAQAGNDAGSQVKLALWCEAHGLTAERTKHLAKAVLTDPTNVAARGLLGLISHAGRWETPDAIAARLKNDEQRTAKLAQYNAHRDAIEGDRRHKPSQQQLAAEHVKLGTWCEQNGLKVESVSHFTQAVILDPYRDTTWKHLGYVKHNGHWMSPDRAAAEQKEVAEQNQADRQWEPLLRKWRSALRDKSQAGDEAQERLDAVTDPRAVPMVVRVFASGTETEQALALAILGRIESPGSTRELAILAVRSDSRKIRDRATKALRGRERRDYVGMLVDRIHAPTQYQVQPVGGPGSPGAMLIETYRYKVLRTYDAPPPFMLSHQFYGYVGYDANGLPVAVRGVEMGRLAAGLPWQRANDLARIESRHAQLLAEANLKAANSQQRLIADINDLETLNAQTDALNRRIVPVLTSAVDAPDLKDDEDGWHKWWYEQVGFTSTPPPKLTITVDASPHLAPPMLYSCFAAGTPVRTIDGRQPIESLRVGDQVLTQDAATGALGIHPIVAVHHNAPSQTIHVALDNGDTLTASRFHRFWRAGIGWTMAKDLHKGDVLRTYDGVAKIVSLNTGPVVPVFNLDVTGSRTFFVGNKDALVHDNTLPDPHLQPFDALAKK